MHMTAHGRPASPARSSQGYPGFPTDAAPLLMAASLNCTRPAMFIENIFSGRYRHAGDARSRRADRPARPMALVTGVETLHGASMKSHDLRGGAALGPPLGAEGESTVTDAGHILRGYESLDETLRSLGASVWREKRDKHHKGRTWHRKNEVSTIKQSAAARGMGRWSSFCFSLSLFWL